MSTSQTSHNKQKRKRGDKRHHGPPHKKRRFHNSQPQQKQLSPEERKTKCLNIIKTLQNALQSKSIDLMTFTKSTECDVGIKIFLNDASNSNSKSPKPIMANLKYKYEDFIVSEIDESGNTVHITNSEAIKDPDSIDKNAVLSESIHKVHEQLSSLIDKDTTQRFIHWYKQAIKQKHNIDIDDNNDNKTDDNDNKKIESFVFDANKDKQQRTGVHKLLKQLQYINTKTNDASCVEARIIHHKFARDRWPRTRGAYLKFVLAKAGMDTTRCLSLINHALHKKTSKTFSVAGTKDKHAVTVQNVTAYHVTCDELKDAVQNLINVSVGNFEYVTHEFKLGDLEGNEFEIALRNVKYYEDEQKQNVSETELEERLGILKNIGFINYFGMQRFGSSSVGTHDIGRAIIAKDFRLAVALLILPRYGESDRIGKERMDFITSGDITCFPKKLYTEKKCLYTLMDEENNYQQALLKIPRNVRTMYTHAYQSYIWNNCVSQRIEKYGYTPVIGDLVMKQKDTKEDAERIDINDDLEYVTEGNIAQYDIFDVVWPLPSPNILHPKLDIAACMDELLKKDGLRMNDFNDRSGDWGLYANYRNITVKPLNVKGCVKEYRNDDELLLDLPFDTEVNVDQISNSNNDSDDKDDGHKIAWIVSFGLPKSSYATMCIRQLLFISSDKLKRSFY